MNAMLMKWRSKACRELRRELGRIGAAQPTEAEMSRMSTWDITMQVAKLARAREQRKLPWEVMSS